MVTLLVGLAAAGRRKADPYAPPAGPFRSLPGREGPGEGETKFFYIVNLSTCSIEDESRAMARRFAGSPA